jgi:transposase
MPRSSLWTKRPRFKPWTGSTHGCRCRPAERHGFEYFRHGTLSLFAALNTTTGAVIWQTVSRHTSAEFVAFLTDVVATRPDGQAIHVIVDNLATHKTQAVRDFLAAHPSVRFHFTPTYSSWLNQVELWFAKIERDLIARGIFTSVADLGRKIRRYIARHNKDPNRSAGRTATRRIALLPVQRYGPRMSCESLKRFKATQWHPLSPFRWHRPGSLFTSPKFPSAWGSSRSFLPRRRIASPSTTITHQTGAILGRGSTPRNEGTFKTRHPLRAIDRLTRTVIALAFGHDFYYNEVIQGRDRPLG